MPGESWPTHTVFLCFFVFSPTRLVVACSVRTCRLLNWPDLHVHKPSPGSAMAAMAGPVLLFLLAIVCFTTHVSCYQVGESHPLAYNAVAGIRAWTECAAECQRSQCAAWVFVHKPCLACQVANSSLARVLQHQCPPVSTFMQHTLTHGEWRVSYGTEAQPFAVISADADTGTLTEARFAGPSTLRGRVLLPPSMSMWLSDNHAPLATAAETGSTALVASMWTVLFFQSEQCPFSAALGPDMLRLLAEYSYHFQLYWLDALQVPE